MWGGEFIGKHCQIILGPSDFESTQGRNLGRMNITDVWNRRKHRNFKFAFKTSGCLGGCGFGYGLHRKYLICHSLTDSCFSYFHVSFRRVLQNLSSFLHNFSIFRFSGLFCCPDSPSTNYTKFVNIEFYSVIHGRESLSQYISLNIFISFS